MTLFSRALRDGARHSIADLSRLIPSFRGKQRLIRSLDQLLRTEGAPTLRRVGEATFSLDTQDLIDFHLFYFEGYERSLLRYLGSQLRPGATVWDIGANVGAVSIPLAAAHPNVSIHAFEPSPPVIARLERNLALNPAIGQRITLHRLALSDTDGVVDFYASAEPRNGGLGSLESRPTSKSVRTQVRTLRGDELIASGEAQVPALIKMDVEGFELEVIRGLKNTLRSHAVTLVFEHEPTRIIERGLPFTSVINELKELGYSIFMLDPRGAFVPFSMGELVQHCDLVATR